MICFVVGLLVLLPFPSWAGLVSLVTSATVLMYAMAPVSLAALRTSDPERPRPYRLPAAKILAPVSFVCANFVVYWSGWNTIVWLYILLAIGFVLFFVYRLVSRRNISLPLDRRSAAWILPWLVGLAVISYLGRYPDAEPKSGWAFNWALLPTKMIPFWADLGAIAAFSLLVYFVGVRFALPRLRVAEALAAAEEEMIIEEQALAGRGTSPAVPA